MCVGGLKKCARAAAAATGWVGGLTLEAAEERVVDRHRVARKRTSVRVVVLE